MKQKCQVYRGYVTSSAPVKARGQTRRYMKVKDGEEGVRRGLEAVQGALLLFLVGVVECRHAGLEVGAFSFDA